MLRNASNQPVPPRVKRKARNNPTKEGCTIWYLVSSMLVANSKLRRCSCSLRQSFRRLFAAFSSDFRAVFPDHTRSVETQPYQSPAFLCLQFICGVPQTRRNPWCCKADTPSEIRRFVKDFLLNGDAEPAQLVQHDEGDDSGGMYGPGARVRRMEREEPPTRSERQSAVRQP
jgi:hypothetical protein